MLRTVKCHNLVILQEDGFLSRVFSSCHFLTHCLILCECNHFLSCVACKLIAFSSIYAIFDNRGKILWINKINQTLARSVPLLGVTVFIANIPRIIKNIGKEGPPFQPLSAAISCLIWVINSWQRTKDWIFGSFDLGRCHLGDWLSLHHLIERTKTELYGFSLFCIPLKTKTIAVGFVIKSPLWASFLS